MENDIIIFPQPQELKKGKGEVIITENMPVIISKKASELEQEANGLIKYLKDVSSRNFLLVRSDGTDKMGIIIRSLSKEGTSEGYILNVGRDQILLEGKSPSGTFCAVQTLKHLIKFKNGRLVVPEVKIRDWPDYKYRGLFIENKWGPDLMSLQDWKNLIDYMASIKLNTLGIGIYGCWCVQYENEITEFFYLPIKKYPELKTPKKISYYSPSRKKEKIINYLPAMFTGDFFGDIIAYGKKRNVIVFPYFNNFGHNTLIPRLHPEVSSKESNGSPTNYGFCLTNPETYKLLFNIYDEIIDRYLKPNGIDIFHIQLDEVYEVNGIDFNDLHRKVDPWCKCDKCSAFSKEDLFINFFVKLAKYLKKKGMKKIIVYADHLSRMGILNKSFVSRLKKESLFNEIVLDCWWYAPEISSKYHHFPSGINNKLGLNLWVKPMTCYYNWDWYGSYLENIFNMLDRGYRENAEGVQSYSVYDYGYDQNYYCLAEYSWKQKGKEPLEQFRKKYAQFIFGSQWQRGKKAIDGLEEIVTKEEFVNYLHKLPYYTYTYVVNGRPYPRKYPEEVIEWLSIDLKKSFKDLKQIVKKITDVEKILFSFKGKKTNFPFLINYWLVECRRMKSLCQEFIIILEIETLRKFAPLSKEVIEKLNEALKMHDEMMAEIEKVKSPYIIPITLRNLMPLRNYLLKNIKDYKKLKRIAKS